MEDKGREIKLGIHFASIQQYLSFETLLQSVCREICDAYMLEYRVHAEQGE